jgi:uncharacterized membrane protein
MNELVLVVCNSLHLLATVTWIGGIVTMLLAVMPGAREGLAGEAGKVLGPIARRFIPLANASILTLIVTGLVLMFHPQDFAGRPLAEACWRWALLLKHAAVLAMVVVHFYRVWSLTPRIGRLSAAGDGAAAAELGRLQACSLNLVKVNLALGILVLFLTGTLPVLAPGR